MSFTTPQIESMAKNTFNHQIGFKMKHPGTGRDMNVYNPFALAYSRLFNYGLKPHN